MVRQQTKPPFCGGGAKIMHGHTTTNGDSADARYEMLRLAFHFLLSLTLPVISCCTEKEKALCYFNYINKLKRTPGLVHLFQIATVFIEFDFFKFMFVFAYYKLSLSWHTNFIS
jgi:hypothetical protein